MSRGMVNWRTLTTAFAAAAVVYALVSRQSHGRMLGVPFEFRFPTVSRLRERLWNAEDPRIFTPHVFGVGWSLNGLQLLRLLRGQRPGDGGDASPQDDA